MPAFRDPGPLDFDAVIRRWGDEGAGAFIEMPFDVPETFGAKGRVPVRATFDGVAYQGSIVKYGGLYMLLFRKDVQAATGKGPGDPVRVHLELDTSERVIELAEDVAQGLGAAGHLDAFRAMSYSHQREYVQWIEDAKQPATRERRIATTVQKVGEGKRLK